MARKYSVWNQSNKETGRKVCWFVTDMTQQECDQERQLESDRNIRDQVRYAHQEEIRPRVATFPVSQLYDSETQERRAQMLADYLNRIQEALDQAEKHAILIDAIKGAPQTP